MQVHVSKAWEMSLQISWFVLWETLFAWDQEEPLQKQSNKHNVVSRSFFSARQTAIVYKILTDIIITLILA